MDNRLPASTLTEAVPSSQQRWLALAVMGSLLLYSMSALPFSTRPGPVWPSFIGIYQTAVIVCDLLTAVLLLFQFRHFRQVGLLILGAGYLFTALVAIVHLLSFPGLFGDDGVIGGPQSSSVLWIAWHGAFPAFVLAYLLSERSDWTVHPQRAARLTALTIGAIVLSAGGATLLAVADVLPRWVAGGNFSQINQAGIGPALAALCLIALVLTARERGRSVIKLWLALTMLAFTLDVFHTLHSEARYTLGWYAARGNSFIASLLILAVYVVENGILLRHWIVSSTQLAEANAVLEQARQKAEDVLSSITDGFYALDGEWRFTYINQRAQSLLGRNSAELMGRGLFEVFPQVKGTEAHEIFSRVMRTRRPEDFDFVSSILKRWTSFSVYPAGDGGISVYFRDISERKAAEAALVAAKIEAERANRAKTQFLASASHDLRQPVQSLYLFQESLALKLRDHPAAQTAARMQAALDALKGLLDGLLDMSKLHAGTITLKPATFPVGPLLERVATEYAPRAATLGIDIRLVPSRASILSDQTQLERILRNLIDNALKYTPSGNRILIGCRRRGCEIRIQVIDTGAGIPEESQSAVFEEFVQLGNPERDRAKGLGLGLAVVRQLAHLLGHPLALDSRVGRGTCISVAVPMAGAGQKRPALMPSAASAR